MTVTIHCRFLVALGLVLFPVSACISQDPDQHRQPTPVLPKDNLVDDLLIETPPRGIERLPKSPPDNPMSREKVALGRRLFFDPILSRDRSVACASCHQPDHGFASPDAKAVGIEGKVGKRNAPSILNRSFGKHFFWDGRVESLEQQALNPISNPDELGGDVDLVLQALRGDESYVEQFKSAFPETSGSPVSADNLARAIASFERTLVTGNAAVDRFRAADYEALTRKARQGMWIFESRGGCWQCHSGPNLTDEAFHNTGVSFGTPNRDTGRFEFTEQEQDKFKFKTPTLRNIEFTAPYMHDGSMKTLREVVEFYSRGGAPKDPGLDTRMKPLNLTEEEIEFLVEFLKSFSGNARIDQRK